jgi:hypothetical protein
MRLRTFTSSGPPRRRALGAAAVAVALGVILGAPAIGADPEPGGGQPPPGTIDDTPDGVVPVDKQPPLGTVDNTPDRVAPVPQQPPNANPDLEGPPTTVVDRSDRGAKNVPGASQE